jgi:hypothetical protein
MSLKALKKRFVTRLVYRNLPFIYFLAVLGLVYIANAHSSEKKMRNIQKLTTELREYKWQYMSVKADLMYISTQSQIERQVAGLGLKGQHAIPGRIKAGKAYQKLRDE